MNPISKGISGPLGALCRISVIPIDGDLLDGGSLSHLGFQLEGMGDLANVLTNNLDIIEESKARYVAKTGKADIT